jgi:membrane protein
MAKFVPAARKSYEFVSEKLWKVRINKIDKRQGILIRQLRVFSLAAKGFGEDNCLTAATALTFYTLFSIVPVLALAFAVAKGFGYEKDLQVQLLANYHEYENVLTNAFVYADKMLATVEGGAIAGIGIVLLIWSVMQLLTNIEGTFNKIWEIKRGRSWVRKVTDYLTIMLLGPVFLIVSAGLTVAVQTRIGQMEHIGFMGALALKVLAYTLVALIFAFIYLALPNTKVKYRPAIIAAIISTIAFEFLGWGYVKFQIGVNRMNAIYGAFAALPLFLIWVQYCWYIVLFGAELTYAYQNVDHYELDDDIQQLSPRYKKVISLLIANYVARRFHNLEKLPSVNDICEKLDLPSRLTRNIVNEFVECGLFVEVRTENNKDVLYQPGIPESKFTVKHLIDTIDRKGVNELPITDSNELQHITELMKQLDRTMDTDLGQVYVKDIIK